MFANLGKKIRAKFNRAVVAGATALGTMAGVATPAEATVVAPVNPIVAAGTVVTKPTAISDLRVTLSYGGIVTSKTYDPLLDSFPPPDQVLDSTGFMKQAVVQNPLAPQGASQFNTAATFLTPGKYNALGFVSPLSNGVSYAVSQGGGHSSQLQFMNTSVGNGRSYSQAGEGVVLSDVSGSLTELRFVTDGTGMWSITVPMEATPNNATLSVTSTFDTDIACVSGGCFADSAVQVNVYNAEGLYRQLANFTTSTSNQGPTHLEKSSVLDLSQFPGETFYLYAFAGAGTSVKPNAVLGTYNTVSRDYNLISSIPEPSIYGLMGIGLLGLGAVRRMKNKNSKAVSEGLVPCAV